MDGQAKTESGNGGNQTFLWVNKNERSEAFGRSDYDETRRILSHVRNRRRKTRDGIERWAAFTSCIEVKDDSGIDPSVASQITKVPPSQRVPTIKAQIGAYKPQTMCSNVDMHWSATQPTLEILSPSYNSSDPFHSTVLGIEATKSMNVISNSVSSRISRITFLAEALAPAHLVIKSTGHRHDRFRQERFRACVNSELLMCSSIAHGSSSLAWVGGNIGDEQQSQHFVTKTLTAVRASLSQNSGGLNKFLVLSIYTLALTELWNAIPDMWQPNPHIIRPNHLQACKTHLRALLILVQSAGGWMTISPYILEGMLLMDKYTAMFNMDKPILPLSWDPGPVPPESRILWDYPASNLPYPGSAFEKIDIGSKLQETLQGMATFTYLATSAWDLQPPLSAISENWLYLKLHTFYYRILLFEHQTDLEYVVKTAALMSQLSIVAYPGGQFFARLMLDDLRLAMKRSWTKLANSDSGLLLWCLCTGVLVEGASLRTSWFAARLAEHFRDLLVPLGLHELSQSLKAYVYVSARQDQSLSLVLRELYGEMLEGETQLLE